MEFEELLTKGRSVRRYRDNPVHREFIIEILKATEEPGRGWA
jgi:hypothetical protein